MGVPKLIKHIWAYEGEELPPISAPQYEFVGAANGIFIRAQREGMEVCMKVGDTAQPVRGLARIEERLALWYPKIPATHLQFVLEQSREVCSDGVMREILFHFSWGAQARTWHLSIPEQDASGGRVKPTSAGHGSSYATSILEVHSHHSMKPFFSSMDDADEQGFKLYGVIGDIFHMPTLRLRVGLYGYFWQIPASWIFDMPEDVTDALARRVRRVLPPVDNDVEVLVNDLLDHKWGLLGNGEVNPDDVKTLVAELSNAGVESQRDVSQAVFILWRDGLTEALSLVRSLEHNLEVSQW